ncbi:MAG: VWA domain-containing protein [Clostridia bacterium]|nr:VWA domain-containing protein [Clostridia bacterium]
MKKYFTVISVLILATAVLSSCSGYAPMTGYMPEGYDPTSMADMLYDEEGFLKDVELEEGALVENPFFETEENDTATFSADVDTASYTMLRKLMKKKNYTFSDIKLYVGLNVRTEELINYFKYDYSEPKENELFGVSSKLVDCPWNDSSKLLILGLKAAEAQKKSANNLVFLIDISGSMSDSDKLPLLKKTFSYLTSNLTEDDTVSIVTYASGEKVILEGCEGNKTEKILSAINKLKADGSTNGEAGLRKAYELAEKYFKPDGNNRIILASDGDLNVGMSSVDEIKEFVSEKRDNGVYLSVLGFGSGNYRDTMMETIADNGNGAYYYIDGEEEAEKIFGGDLLSTLYAVANDTKLQVVFNKDAVTSYRLIGYENRIMSAEDFENDAKDAGEVGAGSSVTACFEIKLAEGETLPDLGKLAVRYKKPGEEQSRLNEYAISSEVKEEDGDSCLIAALCEFAMLLHDSEYMGNTDLGNVKGLMRKYDYSEDPYKAQFAELVINLLEGKAVEQSDVNE